MKQMQKIFVCYYRFQERIGNGDMPVFMSMGMILFAFYLYLTGISTGISFFWVDVMDNQAALDLKTLTFCNIVICCLLGVWFYLKHLRGYRLKETLSIEISSVIAQKIKQGFRVRISDCADYLRLCIREYCWAIFANHRHNFSIDFGYDFYMHIHTDFAEITG